MSKKKKKILTTYQLNASRKQAEKIQKIEFFRKIDELSDALGIENLIVKLAESEKEMLFSSRFRKPSIKSVTAMKLPKQNEIAIQECLDHFLKTRHFKLPGTEREFSYYDFYTCFITLRVWLKNERLYQPAYYEKIFQSYRPLLDYADSIESPLLQFPAYLNALSTILTYPGEFIVQMSEKSEIRKGSKSYIATYVELSIQKYEEKKILFEDQIRTIHPLLILTGEMTVTQIPVSALMPNTSLKNAGLDLYFQKHAIRRLKERIDCLSDVHIFEGMYSSFMNPEIFQISSKKFLVSLYIDKVRLGYFVVVLQENFALIKTFLFLTNDGTPEGNRLRSKMGMCKHEKKHFALDKLSSFYHSDITNDDTIKQLLKDSGCHQLINIQKKIQVFDSGNSSRPSISLPTAASIKNYMKLEEVA